MTKLRLHDYSASGNCYKVRLLLAQLGRDYERVQLDIFDGDTLTAEFAELNPHRSTPVLELADGRVLIESNAILWYLATGTPFLPSDAFGQAEVFRWLVYEQTDVMWMIGGLRFRLLTGRLEPDSEAALSRARGPTKRSASSIGISATTLSWPRAATRSQTSPSTPIPMWQRMQGSTQAAIRPFASGSTASPRNGGSSTTSSHTRQTRRPAGSVDAETLQAVTIEPRVGGRVYATHSDIGEDDWGEVTVWEPGRRLVHTFHLAQDRRHPSEVAVEFVPTADGCTVRFAHGGWTEANSAVREKFGDWPVMLDRFTALAGG